MTPFVYVRSFKTGKNDPIQFGSGFVIHHDDHSSYVVTCWHVVAQADSIKVHKLPAKVIRPRPEGSGQNLGLSQARDVDIAVIKTTGLVIGEDGKPVPPLKVWAKKDLNQTGSWEDAPFLCDGWSYDSKNNSGFARKILKGTLGTESYRPLDEDATILVEETTLLLADRTPWTVIAGYSGCPILDPKTRNVIGIVRYQISSERAGLAVKSFELRRIWPDAPESIWAKPAVDAVEAAMAQLSVDPDTDLSQIASHIARQGKHCRSPEDRVNQLVSNLYKANFDDLQVSIKRILTKEEADAESVRAVLLLSERCNHKRSENCFKRVAYEAQRLDTGPLVSDPPVDLECPSLRKEDLLLRLLDRFDPGETRKSAPADNLSDEQHKDWLRRIEDQIIAAVARELSDGACHLIHVRWGIIANSRGVAKWFFDDFWKKLVSRLALEESDALRIVILCTCLDGLQPDTLPDLMFQTVQLAAPRGRAKVSLEPFGIPVLSRWIRTELNYNREKAAPLADLLHGISGGILEAMPSACQDVFLPHFRSNAS